MVAKLERVQVNEVWKSEVAFTRWLEENLDVLNDVLDLNIETADREQPAGELSKFKVDLVAEDGDGNSVVIENQLYQSDHDHLGKVITYLTAIDAKRAIWIVARPRPEHVRAVTWLNESSNAEFYLMKLEAVKIEGSRPAALLTLIVGPSEEGRAAGETKKKLAERHFVRERFWTSLLERARPRTKLHNAISPSRESWISAGAGRSGLSFNYVIRKNAPARVELYIDRGRDADSENLSILKQLESKKGEIEKKFGGHLAWETLDNRRACRISSVIETAGYENEGKWPNLQDQMIERMIKFESALRPYIDKVKLG